MKIMKVKIRFLEPILGTVPKDKEIYKTYIESKNPNSKEDETVDIQEVEERGWTGFMQDENGIYIFNYMVKGFLKHAGNVLKDNLRIKNLRAKIEDYVFINPRKIYFGKKEVDGVIERPLRGMTMQGPRIALARSDYIKEGTEIEFNIEIIPNKEIDEEVIKTLLEYGKYMGLGQFRGGSYGTFEVINS